MKSLNLAFILVVFVLLVFNFEHVLARGRGGGRGGSRGSRSPSRSRSSGGSRSKPTVYKTTKMPVTSFKSPVINSQTRYVSKSTSPRYPTYIAGGAVTLYALSYAPVYRGYYPMYGCHLHVPQHRGVRVSEERQEIVNRYTNEKCYQVTTKKADGNTPARDTVYSENPGNKELENSVNSTTTVLYNDGTEIRSTGSEGLTLDENKVDEEFNATTITDYDKDISGTQIKGNCTRVVTTTRASMITTYDSNPGANSALVLPATSLILLVLLAFISYKIL